MKKTSFDAAEEKGREAARNGQPFSSCPYEDKRKPSGKLSWSRSFIRAWQYGWQSERMNIGLKPWDCVRCDGTGERFNNASETVEPCGACNKSKDAQ